MNSIVSETHAAYNSSAYSLTQTHQNIIDFLI